MNFDKMNKAVEKAIAAQVLPTLFTPAQLAEAARPFHESYDHYNSSPVMTGEKEFAAFGGYKPQLAINDPRITDAQIAAAPKTITVDVDGKKHVVSLRIYKNTTETVQNWNDARNFQARSREALAALEPAIAKEFNLKAGRDFSIGYGITAANGKKAASFMLQAFSAKAQKQGAEVKKFMEGKLAVLTPERPSKVTISGPIFAG